MPVIRGAVTFSRFRAEPAGDAPLEPKKFLTRGLRARAFEPIDRRTEEERAVGFVELQNPEATGFPPGALGAGEYVLFAYRVDTLKVSAGLLKAELDKWAAAFERDNDRAPSRVEKARSRTELKGLLRQRAVPGTKVHDVSWNLKTHQVQVWASSRKVVDEVAAAMEAAFPIRLELLVPAAQAQRAGVKESLLAPTPELVGVDVSVQEVANGKA
ncbi:MAG: recombination-associated protein RdgC [Myxococcaceae bacterium]|nr:recombination-associated protein RdgC [Myxococcaceae bacterium]MCI0671278.1 recombination-associated protein RdgC [Myxococcaceae bacterium]